MTKFSETELTRRLNERNGISLGEDRNGNHGSLYRLDSGRYAISFGYSRPEEKFNTLAGVLGFCSNEGIS